MAVTVPAASIASPTPQWFHRAPLRPGMSSLILTDAPANLEKKDPSSRLGDACAQTGLNPSFATYQLCDLELQSSEPLFPLR